MCVCVQVCIIYRFARVLDGRRSYGAKAHSPARAVPYDWAARNGAVKVLARAFELFHNDLCNARARIKSATFSHSLTRAQLKFSSLFRLQRKFALSNVEFNIRRSHNKRNCTRDIGQRGNIRSC